MKTCFSKTLCLACSILFFDTLYALPLPPRTTVWGFAGSNVLARGDAMVALAGNPEQIVWGDAQGKYGEEGTWMGSLGTGYRQVHQNGRVLGAYGFMDYSVSPEGNSFWVASPGVESMGCVWDFRINGYFPVGAKTKTAGPNILGNSVGIQSVFFTSHQQYNRLYHLVESVGNGVDGEIGRTFANLNQSRAYLGGYYFNASGNNSAGSASSIQGISGRLEYPLRSNTVLQLIDTYDNHSHNTLLVGVQVSFGHYSNRVLPVEPKTRILDPIPRNLATFYTGSGIPVVKAYQHQGEILERDHIYFFTSQGGAPFDNSKGTENGTYENPLNDTSFVQTTVNDINGFAPGANFYFTPGTYQFNPLDPTSRISLNPDQSMWGRIYDYTLPAQNDNRPLFLGGIDLGVNFAAGNNRLDSIKLLDEASESGNNDHETRAIDIENTANVVLSNDDIRATANILGNLDFVFINSAEGIYANNSQVSVENSTVVAKAFVELDNSGENFSTGIGVNTPTEFATPTFNNNQFTIINSNISGDSEIGRHNGGNGDNHIENYGIGIGGNAAFGGSADFTNNTFIIQNTQISGSGVVNGDNFFSNFATGIGESNNAGISGEFTGNVFTLINNAITATATIVGSNKTSIIGPYGDGQNFALGIGGSSIFGSAVNFQQNQFSLYNTNMNITASAGSNDATNATNFAAGIGGNAAVNIIPTSVNFTNNNFGIVDTNINVNAIIGNNAGHNFATVIGPNAVAPAMVLLTGNTFNINNSLSFNATALVSGVNSGTNQSTGINMNAGGNQVNINLISANLLSQLTGDIGGINNTRGLLATGIGDNITIENSLLRVLASPAGTVTCSSGTVNFVNTPCLN